MTHKRFLELNAILTGGMTQKELIEQLGCNRSSFEKWKAFDGGRKVHGVMAARLTRLAIARYEEIKEILGK